MWPVSAFDPAIAHAAFPSPKHRLVQQGTPYELGYREVAVPPAGVLAERLLHEWQMRVCSCGSSFVRETAYEALDALYSHILDNDPPPIAREHL
jgi:hypothetical protein